MPEGDKKEQETEKLFKKTFKENFPKLVTEIDIKVQEAQRFPNKLDPKRTTPRHILLKCQWLKRESQKQQEKKELPTKEFP